jgi:hypothetical protein
MIKEQKINVHTKVTYNILDVKDKYNLKDSECDVLENHVWLGVDKQNKGSNDLGDYDLDIYGEE